MVIAARFDPKLGQYIKYEHRFVPLGYTIKPGETIIPDIEAACISYAFAPGDEDGPTTVNVLCISKVYTKTGV